MSGVARRVRVEARRLAAWGPYGRHGLGPRGMPEPLPDVRAEVGRYARMGVRRAFLSEPAGATPGTGHDGLGEPYRMLERVASALRPEWRRYADFAEALVEGLLAEGITPVWYAGCPRFAYELAYADEALGLPCGCEVALDGAAAMGAHSPAHRLAVLRGTGRTWIEAQPWKGMEHWAGFRVVMLGAQRLNVEADRLAHRGLGTGPMEDAAFPEIVVAMTGHRSRAAAASPEGEAPTPRDAQRWARAGLTVAVQPWEWDRYAAEVFEVVREGE